ncbi:MT-A70 family methyltransferase [Rubrobacter tropicus]|nr:MT-A70 family methyltransferase [Rubrobacter tropicus]
MGLAPVETSGHPITRDISLDDILVPDGRVREQRHDPSPLAESMRERGQLSPIILTPDLTLVAGLHRYEAAGILGWETIRAEIRDYDEIEARLAEIDENLCRNDLTVWEQSRHVAERERILDARNERAQSGDNRHSNSRGDTVSPLTNERLAGEAGMSERTYQRRHKIGRLGPETSAILDHADATDDKTRNLLNSTTQLDHLANITKKRGDEVAAEVALAALTEEGGNTFKVYEEMKREQDRVEREARRESHRATLREAPPLDRRYEVLVADPPWKYSFSTSDSRRVENQYPTMRLEEIKALEVPAEADAVLFLWATSPKLTEALEVMEAWGFDYRTCMVWVKNRIGMGYYARQQHELVLIGKRGNPPVPEPSDRPSSVFYGDRKNHSAKTENFYKVIERMYQDESKVELFARGARPGFDAWGNEVLGAAS